VCHQPCILRFAIHSHSTLHSTFSVAPQRSLCPCGKRFWICFRPFFLFDPCHRQLAAVSVLNFFDFGCPSSHSRDNYPPVILPPRAIVMKSTSQLSPPTHVKRINDSVDSIIAAAGKRVAVNIAVLKGRVTGRTNAAIPHLRFDKVATRLINRLQAGLHDSVPPGMIVLLTLTAPIRLPSKTAAALQDRINALIQRGAPRRDVKDKICDNRIQVRFLREVPEQAPKMIGFVHNSDSGPLPFFHMTRQLLELAGDEALRRATRRAGDRWLVVKTSEGSSCLQAYQYIHSRLRMPTGFKKTLIVFGDGRVATLNE